MKKGSGEPLHPQGGSRATPSFGEVLPRITEHFTLEGALGVVVVDASRLAVIEQQYGAEEERPQRHLR